MTPTPTDRQPVNHFELQGREAKSVRLARWLYAEFLRTATGLSEEEWQNSAARAGVSPLKEDGHTQARVMEILKGRAII
jgi:hypothetical protein